MLTGLTVENFRGFDKHKIPLNEVTVIVGQNNAGKSTLVEAFRLIAIVTGRYRNLSYKPSPPWLDLPRASEAVFDALSAELLAGDRSLGAGGANKEARKIIKGRKKRGNDFLTLVSGKTLISDLSRWSQDEFGVSINPMSIARGLRLPEVHQEIVAVITAIENCSRLSSP